jgi:tetratricopeptide (TPR) repeat protein
MATPFIIFGFAPRGHCKAVAKWSALNDVYLPLTSRLMPLFLLLGFALRAEPAASAGAQADAAKRVEMSALIDAQRLPEARQPLEALLARSPTDLETIMLLARVYNGLGRRDEVITLLEPAVAAHPNEARVLGLYAGNCMLRAGELSPGFRSLRLARRGHEVMEQAVLLAPKEISYREGLVDFYRQAPRIAGGDMAKAQSHALAIAKLDPVRGAAWQASIYLQQKKLPEALAACDRALAARPDDYVALFTLGRAVAESGRRLEEGEAALRRCLAKVPLESEPSHAAVLYRIGLIKELRKDISGARAAYQAALALEPNFNRPAEELKRLAE